MRGAMGSSAAREQASDVGRRRGRQLSRGAAADTPRQERAERRAVHGGRLVEEDNRNSRRMRTHARGALSYEEKRKEVEVEVEDGRSVEVQE